MSALKDRLFRWMPGLPELVRYQRMNLRPDVLAGLSVAAVALPVSIAYAQLAGFSPVVGLYSTILPMLVYALFGTSRQLIMGPDAATCAMIAATLTPLAVAGSEQYLSFAVTLTLMAGVFCIIAGKCGLGFFADFLSRPILMGLLNGVGINIIISQLGKVTKLALQGHGVISQLESLLRQLPAAHGPTVALALGSLAVFLVVKYAAPRVPAPLVAMVAAVIVSGVFGVARHGVAVVGEISSALPAVHLPALPPPDSVGTLVTGAAGLALISFCSAMSTCRGFAAKNGYDIDASREFVALGACDLASALSQGFAISGADSRTAVNDSVGGKTRLVSVVAALTVLLALFLFTNLIALIPTATLGAILIGSSLGLMNFRQIWNLRRYSRAEFRIALATLAGVVLIGVMEGIVLAVTLALVRFLSRIARPPDHELGRIAGMDGFYELAHYPEAEAVPGLLIYRFESPLTFFNADYFRQRVLQLVARARGPVRWVLLDAVSITDSDITGMLAVKRLEGELRAKNIRLTVAGREAEFREWLDARGLRVEDVNITLYPSRHIALAAYLEASRKDVETWG
ncbi:MAG: SulP family inorganic anion transporter [Verrucomicrobiales bacterium]|jgi:high affinity sulfate transporter 1|nr:SulP family inorganic anion transporter [Verrucomicrobiales bacterium]